MFKKFLAFGALIAVLGGCAQMKEPYTLRSLPSNAKVVIIDTDTNKTVDQGYTPYKFSFSKYDGYYGSKRYLIRISKEGYKTFEYRIIPNPNSYSLTNGGRHGTIWELEPAQKEYLWHDSFDAEVLLTDDKEAQKRMKLRKLAK